MSSGGCRGFDSPTVVTLRADCYCKSPASGGTFELVDLDGDGRVDLVEPADWKSFDAQPSTSAPPGLLVWGHAEGKPYWKYYPGDGHAFGSTAISWRVPTRAVGEFNGLAYRGNTGGLDPDWFTVDFNGDGRPDLVDFGSSTASESNSVVVYFGIP